MYSLFDEEPQVAKLSHGFPKQMVLLDLETTGGKANYHRIIEIGLLVVNDGQEVDRWHTLVNPEVPIPANIQKLTGITEQMIVGAPSFAEVAGLLMEKLMNRTLVAHNARFDYGFLKNELNRVGIHYSTKPLCSVKLSRRLFPQFKRHSLDQIIKRFNLTIDKRHRAFDDAFIIYQFFNEISRLIDDGDIGAACKDLVNNSSLPVLIDKKAIEKLPTAAGVYYFYDNKGKLLYIGKSVNIRQRVMSHFSQDYNNSKDGKINQHLAHIDYRRTPSDLGAQLLESQEIKAKFPLYNHRLRRARKLVYFKLSKNSLGYLEVSIETLETNNNDADITYGLFRSQKQAKQQLERIADQYHLCHQFLGLEPVTKSKPCFRYQLKRCAGACTQEDPPEDYNERLQEALHHYQVQIWPWDDAILVVERDLIDNDFVAYHLVNQWRYIAKLEVIEDIYQYGYQPIAPHSHTIGQPLANIRYNNSLQSHSLYDETSFDLDTYFILVRFLTNTGKSKINGIDIVPLLRYE